MTLAGALLACTPKLHGVCSSDAQCAADEVCGAEGLCIARVSDVRVDTPDDSGGAGWYRGASASPPAATIELSAVPPPAFRARTWAYYEGTTDSVEGHEAGGRWRYVLPRANAPATIIVESSDANGARAPSGGVDVKFDAVTAFAPTVNPDLRWYAGAGDGSISIPVTFAALPASGLASVVLRAGNLMVPAVRGTDSQHWTAALPRSLAQANSEAAIAFTVTATSLTGAVSSVSGSRNFDTKPPAIAAINVLYPAPRTDPTGWSTDGAHFHVRDSGPLLAVTVYDCGAGLRQFTRSSVPEVPGLVADFTATGQTVACPSPLPPAKTYTLTLSGDLSGVAMGAIGLDTVLKLTALFDDDARAPDGSATVTNRATVAQGVNVTRRLWSSQIPGATMLALAPGPTVAAAGTQGLWTATAAAAPVQRTTLPVDRRPVVATNGGDTRILLLAADLFHAVPLAGPDASCRLGAGSFVNRALALRDPSTAVALFDFECKFCTYSSPTVATLPIATTGTANPPVPCGVPFAPQAASANAAAVGRNDRLFWTDGANLQEADLATVTSSAPRTTAIANASALALTDNAGSDALIVGGPTATSRTSYDGLAFGATTTLPALAAQAMTVALGPSHTLVGTSASAATDLAQVELAAGVRPGIAAAVTGNPLVLIDARRPVAIAYVAHAGNASSIASFFVDPVAGLSPGPLPAIALPAAIDDAILGADGVLYVLGGGVVYAYQTDSPGLGTAAGAPNALAWPADQRDACRSSNLAYSCPN